MPITIAVIEDHPVFLAHFTSLIQDHPDFRLVGTATTGKQALNLIRDIDAEIYLLDLGLPDFSGLELLPVIAALRPNANAMVISIFDDDANIVSAIENGATGYLLKDAEPSLIISSLRDLHAGKSPLSPAVAKKILAAFRSRGEIRNKETRVLPASSTRASDKEMLTERESQVLRELALGLAFREIAESLSISSHTVAQHVRNIYRKLAVSSRGKAVYEATKLGILRK